MPDNTQPTQYVPAGTFEGIPTTWSWTVYVNALSDDDGEELCMTIAYLKRSLKAITVAMEAAAQLIKEKSITREQHAALQQRLFQVRDGIILLMGEFRGEWLRRYGSL